MAQVKAFKLGGIGGGSSPCCCGGNAFCTCTGLPSTLTLTHSIFGACTITFGGTNYDGTCTYPWVVPACTGSCGSWFIGQTVNVPIEYFINCTGGGTVWNITIFCPFTTPGCVAPMGCPNSTGTLNVIKTKNQTSKVCSPLNVSWSFPAETCSCSIGGTIWGNLTKGVSSTITITP